MKILLLALSIALCTTMLSAQVTGGGNTQIASQQNKLKVYLKLRTIHTFLSAELLQQEISGILPVCRKE
jgi:hypothetical protein